MAPQWLAALAVSAAIFAHAPSLRATTTNYLASSTWICPTNVFSVQAECWGGGGGGAGTAATANRTGAGGAGGAYAKNESITVVPGTSYTVTVGAGGTAGATGSGSVAGTGGSSSFSGGVITTITAVGGAGATAGNGTGAASGSSSGNAGFSGSFSYAGGNAANGLSASYSGGGGGAAGSNGAGGNASTSSGGTAGTGGGNGTNGVTVAGTVGGPGYVPGGGGSGGYATTGGTAKTGGAGGAGQITLTYTKSVPTTNNSTVVASPAGVPADGAMASTITITLKDAGNNLISGKTVTLASSRGATDTISAASGASTNGMVVFFVTSSTAGLATFTATDTTDSVVITNTATVNFGTSIDQLAFITPAQTDAAGAASATITIQLQDSGGTPKTYGTNLSVNLSTTSSTGVFRDTGNTTTISTVTILAGTNSASFKYKDTVAPSTSTITATAGSLTPATQIETITNAAASLLAFTTQPASTNLGATLAPVIVQLQDQYSNTVAQSGTAVTLALNGAALASGTVTQNTDASGKATFNHLVVGGVASGLTFTATASGLTSATSGTFNITSKVVVKLPNANAMNLTTSWNGGVLPGVNDTAQFDNTSVSATAANDKPDFGASTNYYGMNILGWTANNGYTVSNTAGNLSMTLGAGGITGQALTHTFTFQPAIILGGSQIWNWGTTTNGISFSLVGNLNLNGSSLVVTGTDLVTLSGSISGNGSLLNSGIGTLAIAGTDSASGGLTNTGSGTIAVTSTGNTYAGDTTLADGTLTINSTANLCGNLNLAGGTFSTTASRSPSSAPLTNNIILTANSTIATTSAAGTVDLNLSGSINATAGSLTFSNANTAGTNIFQPRLSGEGLTLNQSLVIANGTPTNTTLLQSVNTNAPQTFSAVISGNGSFKRTASSNGTGGNTIFNAANNFSGGVTLNDGGLGLGIDSSGSPTVVSGPLGTGPLTVGNIYGNVFASGGAHTVGNPVVFNSGKLTFGDANDLTLTGTIDLGGSVRTLQVDNTHATILSGIISNGGLTKTGNGALTLSGVNNYSGNTTINAGTLVLSGGALITNTANIVVAGNAVLDVSGLSSAFTLASALSSQTLSNSAVGAVINGANDCSVGTISLVYDGVNPSFLITNGSITLSASTTFQVNNTGATLTPGTYRIIAKATTGNVGLVAGAAPSSVTVAGGPIVGTPSLAIVNGELYLTVGGTSGWSYTSSAFTYNGSAQTPTINFSGSTGAKTTNYVGTGATTYSSVNAPTNAGFYYVSNTVAADANYFGATGFQAFTIGAKAASVTADAKIKTYGDVNPLLTAVTNGAVNGDVINVTIATDATQYSALGVSNITVTALSNPNYIVATTNSTLTINQASTFVGATSTNNPSGYKVAVAFTATLPADVSGDVMFSSTNGAFSTNTLSSGSAISLSITNLPRGTNVITVAYLGDGNYIGSTNSLDQIVTNHPPVAVNATCYRAKGLSLKIAITNLLSNVTDVDGDTITLQSVGTGLTNASIMTDSTYVYYLPGTGAGSNDNDVVSYTVSDGFGGTATANILVNVYSAVGPAQMSPPTNGVVNITFFGIPNYTYVVQTTTNLSVPWWTLSTNTASTNGSWQFFADQSGGNTSTLNGWSLDITTVPEPVNVAMAIFGVGFVGVGAVRSYRCSRKAMLQSPSAVF